MNRKNRKVKSKPVFCHDENLEFYLLKKHCNQFARFESVAKIFKTSAKDPLLIQECNKKNIHIITHNTRHFLKPKEKIKIGIVCVNTQEEESFIPKFIKLFGVLSKHKDYYNKIIVIGSQITVLNRLTGEKRII